MILWNWLDPRLGFSGLFSTFVLVKGLDFMTLLVRHSPHYGHWYDVSVPIVSTSLSVEFRSKGNILSYECNLFLIRDNLRCSNITLSYFTQCLKNVFLQKNWVTYISGVYFWSQWCACAVSRNQKLAFSHVILTSAHAEVLVNVMMPRLIPSQGTRLLT